jgi:hypothetical protein
MSRAAVSLAIALLLAASTAARAVAPVDTNQLLKICTGKDTLACEGFIMGALGMHLEDAKTHPIVCPARSSTPQDLRQVVVKYMQAHPETRSLKAAGVTVLALHQAFPCGK